MADPEKSEASMLVKDLDSVASIVGALGMEIAGAQKAFNLDYIENIERILAMVKDLLGTGTPSAEAKKTLRELLTSLAPPRYQYTETTLAVRLELGQSLKLGGKGTVGVGFSAVTVSASFMGAYGYDYRAAAECRTVIHASNGPNAFNSLLDKASTINATEIKKKLLEEDNKILAELQHVKAALT